MINPPLISVILPVYNGEKYLGEAIDSVFSQDYPRVELVVVDDGSTDRSWEIIQSYPGIKAVRKENGGVASARNLGVGLATGSFCAFLDQDDYWAPSKLSIQMASLSQEPTWGFVVCYCQQFIDENNPPSVPILPEIFKPHKTYLPSSWLMRKEVLEEAGGFNESFRYGDDTNLLFALAERKVQHGCCSELLLYRRLHKQNASHDHLGGYSMKELLLVLRYSNERKRQRTQ